MQSLALRSYQSGDIGQGHSVTELPPTLECEIVPGQLTSQVWAVAGAEREVQRVALLPQGWNTRTDSLQYVARGIADTYDGMAGVIFSLPRIPFPRDARSISRYVRSNAVGEVARLRALTVARVGQAVCDRYGLDPAQALDVVPHSLGTLDTVRALSESLDGEAPLQARSMTALAPAGRLRDHQVLATLYRAVKTVVTPCGNSRNVPAERFGAVRNVLNPAILQTSAEAAYGLSSHIDTYSSRLKDLLPAVMINFGRDGLFPSRNVRWVPGFLESALITEGSACHCAPGHPSETARILQTAQTLWARTPYPGLRLGV